MDAWRDADLIGHRLSISASKMPTGAKLPFAMH
jgi:hypothetical protein